MNETLEDAMWEDGFSWNDPETNPLRAGWYSLNDILARAIIPALNKLISDMHGYPAELVGGPHEHQSIVLGEPEGEEKEAVDKWQSILMDIRNGFQAHLDLNSLYSVDFDTREAYDQEHARLVHQRKKGLELFAKWYSNLWD